MGRNHVTATRSTVLLASVLMVAVTAMGLIAPPAARAETCRNTPTGAQEQVRSPYAPAVVEGVMQTVWDARQQPADNPMSYLIHVPDDLPDGPVPLVMTIHGLLGSAKQHLAQTGWAALADAHGFIVVAPEGMRRWDMNQGSADSAFLRDVVADVRMRDCVDASRLYVTGHSNGAFMTHRMACESADLFAAGASYAAGEIGSYASGTPCAGDGLDADGQPIPGWEPLPLAMWHGNDDGTVSYQGGRRGLDKWLERYDCDTVATTASDEFGQWETFDDCVAGDFNLVFRTLEGHGHAWPDGCGGQQSTGGSVDCEPEPGTGPWPGALDLTRELWAYLSAHTRDVPAAAQPAPAVAPPPGPQLDDVATITDSGVRTNVDSHPEFLRDAPAVADDVGITVTLTFRVSYTGDAAGAGDIHPLCPTSNAGPGTQSMPGREVMVSAENVNGDIVDQAVTTQPLVITHADGSEEHVERVLARLDGRFDPANTVLRASYAGDALGLWWACSTPEARYKETFVCDRASEVCQPLG